MQTKDSISNFYDDYTVSQQKIGVSTRHHLIYNELINLGLKKNSNVLEIGCGIGTVSSLIIPFIQSGKFVGCDISPKSIELAQKLKMEYYEK